MKVDDKIHKFTLNIPLDMFVELKKRTAPGNDIRRVSTYLIAVIRSHLKHRKNMDLDGLIEATNNTEKQRLEETREFLKSIKEGL